MLWVFLYADTRVAEGVLGVFALVRGLFVFLHPDSAFPPLVEEALAAVVPLRIWGLTGIVPGVLQLGALTRVRRVRYRRWAAYSNVGVLWMVAVLWALVVPGQLGAIAYGTLGTIQLYLAIRLAAEPDQ